MQGTAHAWRVAVTITEASPAFTWSACMWTITGVRTGIFYCCCCCAWLAHLAFACTPPSPQQQHSRPMPVPWGAFPCLLPSVQTSTRSLIAEMDGLYVNVRVLSSWTTQIKRVLYMWRVCSAARITSMTPFQSCGWWTHGCVNRACRAYIYVVRMTRHSRLWWNIQTDEFYTKPIRVPCVYTFIMVNW